MARFNFQRFLAETGVSLARLAAHLRVAQSYLEAAAAGRERLTARDLAACRLLWRRLTQAEQLELPFAEPADTFTKQHARLLARARSRPAKTASKERPSPADDPPQPAPARSRKRVAGRAAPKRPQGRPVSAPSRAARRTPR